MHLDRESVLCRWYIDQLSVVYRSTVSHTSAVLIWQVSPMAFLSNDIINVINVIINGGKCCSVRHTYYVKQTKEHWQLGTR